MKPSICPVERLLIECSHKHRLDSFADLAGEAGLEVERVWMDGAACFSVLLLAAALTCNQRMVRRVALLVLR